ncbi:MAG: rane fusion protein multidrug efflux system [Alphaproteobacteria bacterium]|nr:rane fusion protein multidrug efflux system [Alphaproteobacteria bacterium]
MPKASVVSLIGMVTLAAFCSAGGFIYGSWARSADRAEASRSASAVPVSIAIAARKDIPVYLTGLGTVQASSTVAIHSQVDGELEDVLFTEGQQVKRGDVLAKIEPRLYRAALDQAKAKRAQDAALLVAAEKYLTRYTALGQKNFVSQQDVEQQQAKVDQLKASIAADEAAIETAETQLDYTTIRAPNDGRVGIRLIDRGNLVRASEAGAITTLVVTRPSAVLFTLPANNLDAVRAAMVRGSVVVTAFDQDNRQALSTGRLLLIDNSIDTATATVRLKAIFANNDDRLWPGEFVNARALIETRRNALTIPAPAVQRGPGGLFTWVVSANNTAVPRPIQVGPTTDDVTIVIGGLTAGETVVAGGQYRLQPNVPVTITQPSSAVSRDAK